MLDEVSSQNSVVLSMGISADEVRIAYWPVDNPVTCLYSPGIIMTQAHELMDGKQADDVTCPA